MNKLLIVVDMQYDFISGPLGTPEAEKIVPNVVDKIKGWDGDIIVTQDTHGDDYMDTQEGRKLPVLHCYHRSYGHIIHKDVMDALKGKNVIKFIEKSSFGSPNIIKSINGKNYGYIEIIGLCTDICVVSNAILVKCFFPETEITVDASCCAGVTPKSHKAALTTMKMCQIDVIGE